MWKNIDNLRFDDLNSWVGEDSLEEVVRGWTYNDALSVFSVLLSRGIYDNLNEWYTADARDCCIAINAILPPNLAWSYD